MQLKEKYFRLKGFLLAVRRRPCAAHAGHAAQIMCSSFAGIISLVTCLDKEAVLHHVFLLELS